jgi:2-amino-4-hydroxy-6-hydroxymethyldihydropteridine diphosphokinase
MPRALIGLGANLGDRHAQLDAALEALARDGQVRELARSAWRETAPIGGPSEQPAYLNGAALFETSLDPHALWRRMADIEASAGRVREVRWGARTLDLDLLLYDEQIIADATLSVPHPRLALRRFVLEPAAEIAATMMHPVLCRTLGEIAEHVKGTPPVAAMIGGTSAERRELASRISQLNDARGFEVRESHPSLAATTLDEEVPLTALPRLLIALEAVEPRQWTAALRKRVGPIVQVDARDLDQAAAHVALAMQGLSDPGPTGGNEK